MPLEGLRRFELRVRGQLVGLLRHDPKARNDKNPAVSGGASAGRFHVGSETGITIRVSDLLLLLR